MKRYVFHNQKVQTVAELEIYSLVRHIYNKLNRIEEKVDAIITWLDSQRARQKLLKKLEE